MLSTPDRLAALVPLALLLATPPALLAQKEDTPPPAKKPTGKVLTTDTLGEMLDAMGYDAKPITLDNGYQLFGVSAKQDTWTFYVEVSIPRAGNSIGFLAPLTQVGEKTGGKLPAPAMKKMLEANWDLMPHAFVLHAKQQRVFLMRMMDNKDVTSAKLRAALEDMFGTIRRTNDIWNPDRWGAAEEDGGVLKGPPKPGDDTKPDNTVDNTDVTPQLTEAVKKVAAAAKDGDQAAVAALVKKLMLPDADSWFRAVFGDAVGGKLADDYTETRKQNEESVVRLFLTAAEEGQDQIQVVRFTKPDPDKATGNQNKALEAMKDKTPLYSVRLVKAGEDTGAHVYSFAAVNGKPRYVGKLRGIPDRGERGLLPTTPAPSGAVPGEPEFPITGLDAAVERMFREMTESKGGEPRMSAYRQTGSANGGEPVGLSAILHVSTAGLTSGTRPAETRTPSGVLGLNGLMPGTGVSGFTSPRGPSPELQPFSSLLAKPSLPVR